LVVLPVGNE
jgi:hypothetical protein